VSAAQNLENGATSAAERLDPRIWKTVVVVMLGPFMAQMDSTVVNVSLSTIRQELHATIASAQWIISGYLLALALTLPLNGWLVDRIGAKRLYLSCFSAFTLTSLLCGAAQSMDQLIGARLLQGMAGGLLAPLTQLMLARIAGKHMARVLGYGAIPILIAPTVGPIVAGAILKYAGWSWLFYVNLPFGILAVILAALLLPGDEALVQKRPFDLAGFLMISPGLACLIYGFEQASRREVNAIFLLPGLALLGTFIWHARRKKSAALVDLELFKNKTFATATVTQFLSNGVMYGGQLLVPLFLITGCGLTAAETGWILAPMGVGIMFVYPFLGRVIDRFGFRTVSSAGVLLNVAGTVPFLWMALNQYSAPMTIICLLARGIGQGLTGIPTISAAYASIPKDRLSIATTALNIVQRIGGPMTTTALAIVIASTAGVPGPRAFLLPFLALNLLQLLVLGSALRLPGRAVYH